METKNSTASTVQGGAANISQPIAAHPSRKQLTLIPQGQGSADTARDLQTLAQRLARQLATRAEAFGSRAASADTLAELESITHEQCVRAWRVSGAIPQLGELYGSRDYMRGNGRLAWLRALKRAEVEVSAELYSERRGAARMVALDDDSDNDSGENQARADRTQAARSILIRGKVARRAVRHARECLVAFWTLSGSRKWRGALRDDLQTLARLVYASRYGSAILGDSGDTFNGSAQRKAIQRLIQRIGQGDVLLTDQAERADELGAQWRAERASNGRALNLSCVVPSTI